MIASKPNIVLIHGHDVGRYLGAYGRRVSTPRLDALSAEGVRFTRAFCPAPQCSPSRASMMTGRYPHRNGMMGLAHLDWELNDPREALPHRLKEAGYATYLFGEQHEASRGEILGYDHCFGTEWPQLARVVAPAFADYLDKIDEPFFASVGFFEAHRPFDHPGYDDDDPATVEIFPYLPDTPEVRRDIAALNGRVKALDEGVGVVLDALERHNLRDKTLVVFTTDHGLAFPRAKGTLYDAGLEVALFMAWPGVIPAGQVRHELLCNVDLAPTLLSLAGVEPAQDLDGRSFLELLTGDAGPVRDHFMCEMTWHDRYAPVRGIRTERWKYIRHYADAADLYLSADVEQSPSGRAYRERVPLTRTSEELYDLARDPNEIDNLVREAEHADILDELRRRLDDWMRATNDPLLSEGSGA